MEDCAVLASRRTGAGAGDDMAAVVHGDLCGIVQLAGLAGLGGYFGIGICWRIMRVVGEELGAQRIAVLIGAVFVLVSSGHASVFFLLPVVVLLHQLLPCGSGLKFAVLFQLINIG